MVPDALEARIRSAVLEKVNAHRPAEDRLASGARLTLDVLKEFVACVRKEDSRSHLVASRRRDELVGDVAAYLEGTLKPRPRKSAKKRTARNDVQLNYETLQQVVDLVHDAWQLARQRVLDLCRANGQLAGGIPEDEVIRHVGATCPELRCVSKVFTRLSCQHAHSQSVISLLDCMLPKGGLACSFIWHVRELLASIIFPFRAWRERYGKRDRFARTGENSDTNAGCCRLGPVSLSLQSGDFYAVLRAMPDHLAILAACGNDKVVRVAAAYLERLLHAATVARPLLLLVGLQNRHLYDKYIERFNSLLSRQLGRTRPSETCHAMAVFSHTCSCR